MWRAVHDVCTVNGGYPFRARVIPESGGDVAVIQLRDVEQHAWTTPDRLMRLSNRDHRFDKYLLMPGDVLFQSRGTRNLAIEFPVSIQATPASGLYYLRHDANRIEPAYLAWCINHHRTRQAIREVARGSTIEFVPKADLGAIKIPVPSLEAQRHILDIVELRAKERELAEGHARLLDSWTDAMTWRLATRPRHKKD
jgi:hypothetical protein